MKNADLVFQKGHAQSAENSLENDGAERGKAKPSNPWPPFITPKPDRQNDRQESDG